MAHWIAVHTHANAEDKATSHLKRQGFDAYLPRYLKRRRHARKTDFVARALFPRYLFVRLDETQSWRAIQSTVGVSALVTNGDGPGMVPDALIEQLKLREDDAGMVALNPADAFAINQSVRIVDGPLADHVGQFQGLSGDQRVMVLLDLMGRSVKVKVPFDALAKAS